MGPHFEATIISAGGLKNLLCRQVGNVISLLNFLMKVTSSKVKQLVGMELTGVFVKTVNFATTSLIPYLHHSHCNWNKIESIHNTKHIMKLVQQVRTYLGQITYPLSDSISGQYQQLWLPGRIYLFKNKGKQKVPLHR